MEPKGQKQLEPPVMEKPTQDVQLAETQVVEDVTGTKPEHTASDATHTVETPGVQKVPTVESPEVQKVPAVETPEVQKSPADGDPPATPAPSGEEVGAKSKEEITACRKACPCFDHAHI